MIDIIQREDNESTLQYYKRIKDAVMDGVVELDDRDIYEVLFNRQASEDHSQKARRILDLILEADGHLPSMALDNDPKLLELRKERYKAQTAQLLYNRQIRQEARFEMLYDNIKNAIRCFPVPEFEDIDLYYSNKEYVLGISDFHYGIAFVSNSNEYSTRICQARVEALLSEVKELVVQNSISKLKIINLGDSIQGILRLKDLTMNQMPVVDAVVGISQIISTFLNELSKYCNIEYYPVISANHSQTRNLGSKANDLASEDMERIIASYIRDVLKDNQRVQIIFNSDKDYNIFKIFDFNVIALHGHQVKNPDNVIKDLSNLHRVFYDYAFLGHRHSANEIIVGEQGHHNIEVLSLPSIIGSDPYADSLMKSSKAGAKIFIFDKKYGHIGSRNIILN